MYHYIAEASGSDGLISVVQPPDFVVGIAVESLQPEPLTLSFWGIALVQSVAIPYGAIRSSAPTLPVSPA